MAEKQELETVVYIGARQTHPGLPRKNFIGKLYATDVGLEFHGEKEWHKMGGVVRALFTPPSTASEKSFAIPWSSIRDTRATTAPTYTAVMGDSEWTCVQVTYYDAAEEVTNVVHFALFSLIGLLAPEAQSRELATRLWDERSKQRRNLRDATTIQSRETQPPLSLKLTDDECDEFVEDMQKYLRQVQLNAPDYNRSVAKSLISRWGNDNLLEQVAYGYRVVVFILQAAASPMELTRTLNYSSALVVGMIDYLYAIGDTSTTRNILAFIIRDYDNEDTVALVALALACREFMHRNLQNAIQERLMETEGTSCRMALALALCYCGDDSEIIKLVRDGYLMDFWGKANSEEKRQAAKDLYAQQILRTVLEDIATNGVGFSSPLGYGLPWTRKRSSETSGDSLGI